MYFAGRRIAMEDSAGNQHYYWSDHLGSAGVITNSNGSSIQWEADYYPFGTKRIITQNLTNYYLFTGDQFDYETGYNYAINREQSPNLGRFFSLDPVPGDVTNPQSWNRYSYVMNRPSSAADPLGLDGEGGASGVPIIGPIIGGILAFVDIFGGGGGSGPSFHPNGPPIGRSGAGQDSGPLAGETLGLPNTIRLPRPGLADLILPVDLGCEFGPCSFAPGGAAGAAQGSNCILINGSTVCRSFIDKLNLMEFGKTNYRDALPICSVHVTVSNSTGSTQSHVDLFNPQSSLPAAPGVRIPLLPLHLVFDALPDAIYRATGSYVIPAGRDNCR